MMPDFRGHHSQPDILEVIADLSSNEVFTPPRVADALLDLLPESVWRDKSLRWLDPAAKTGVFPRQITRRLMVGLREEIPDDDKRLHHILSNQVHAIAISGMTAMIARRSLYCSKDATSQHSALPFPAADGKVWYRRVEHLFDAKGRCRECGGTRAQLERSGRDNYAYAFIHELGLNQVAEEFSMQFDVIVGNPPYQMDDEGGHRPVPIYHHFMNTAIKLNPRYIAMITPSRWMAGGLGLSEYRSQMLKDKRIRAMVDFPVASEVFGSVEIKGGVSYFLWNRDEEGPCAFTLRRGDTVVGPESRDLSEYDVLVRDSRALPILRRVRGTGATSFSELVASVRPFGDQLRSNFRDYRTAKTAKKSDLKLFMNDGTTRHERWVSPSYVTNNLPLVKGWKLYVPKAASDGGQRLPDVVLGRWFVGAPNTVCTETYLAIGPFKTKVAAESASSYLRTRFARFLVSLRKPGQDTVPGTFEWLPQQAWDRTWSDEDLYTLYNVTEAERRYIESVVKEMPS